MEAPNSSDVYPELIIPSYFVKIDTKYKLVQAAHVRCRQSQEPSLLDGTNQEAAVYLSVDGYICWCCVERG